MLGYILRRILLFIPTMIAISLVAFLISVNAPGDPVDRLLNAAEGDQGNLSVRSVEKLKRAKRHELGLDKPLFYISLGTLADIDTLERVPDRNAHEMLSRLSRRTGNPEATMRYYLSLQELVIAQENLQLDSTAGDVSSLLSRSVYATNNLQHISADTEIVVRLTALDSLYRYHPAFTPLFKPYTKVVENYSALVHDRHAWRTYIPTLHWHGLNNQYHTWISRVIKGDFGVSYRDQQPVMTRISQKFWWSFSLTVLSVLLAAVISIPIGVWAAYKRDKAFDRITTVVLFILYSLPTFFVGTLLLVLFANPDFFNWLPEGGVQNPIVFDENWPFFQKLAHWGPYLILPLITYTYSSLAFISRQVRAGVVEVLQQDYIRTARAKGVPETRILWKHAFRNALLPVITIFAHVLPAVIAGSVIIETIFSIPGMGLEIYESILNYDYPMIVAVFSIFGFLTLFGYLLSDILYAVADPRIKFTAK
jgi:peptide/nickel transport system permease protein